MQPQYLPTALVLSALVPAIFAQEGPIIPDCAISCLASGIPASCNDDLACVCTADMFIQAISSCACAACSTSDYEATVDYARFICDPAGVDLNLGSSCISSELSSSSSTTTSSSPSSTSTSTSSPSPAIEQPNTSDDVSSTAGTALSDSTAEASSENPDGGLDMGTKVGIGVGAGLGGLFLLLLAFLLGRRHAKGSREKYAVTGAGTKWTQRPPGPELEGKDARTEIMDNEKEWPAAGYEHPPVSERAELEAISKQRAELDASRTQKHQLQ